MQTKSHRTATSTITYLDEGEGDVLVLIHGLAADCHMYHRQVDAFRDQYRLIVPNLIGNGDSSTLDCAVDKVLDVQTAALLNLLDELGVKDAVFAGTSYGGIVCQHIAINHPDRVRALVLTDTFCEVSQRTISERLNYLGVIASQPLFYWRGLLKFLMRLAYRDHQDVATYFEQTMGRIRSREALIQRRAINRVDFTHHLSHVTQPTLLLVGDRFTILIDAMKTIQSQIDRSKLEIVPHSFDPSNLINVDYWNRSVETFLNEQLQHRSKSNVAWC